MDGPIDNPATTANSARAASGTARKERSRAATGRATHAEAQPKPQAQDGSATRVRSPRNRSLRRASRSLWSSRRRSSSPRRCTPGRGTRRRTGCQRPSDGRDGQRKHQPALPVQRADHSPPTRYSRAGRGGLRRRLQRTGMSFSRHVQLQRSILQSSASLSRRVSVCGARRAGGGSRALSTLRNRPGSCSVGRVARGLTLQPHDCSSMSSTLSTPTSSRMDSCVLAWSSPTAAASPTSAAGTTAASNPGDQPDEPVFVPRGGGGGQAETTT